MLSEHLQAALQRAADLAQAAGHEYITQEHLLLALLGDPEAKDALNALGADLNALREALTEQLAELDILDDPDPDFTLGVHRVVQGAVLQLHASGKGKEQADGARVLVELLEEDDSPARAALEAQGVTRLDLLNYLSHGVAKAPGHSRERRVAGVDGELTAEGAPAEENPLEAYAQNLTEAAKNGEFDPVIGRGAELERVVHILARRGKNNPVLVGEPGVGKTALAEGLAQRVADGKAPGFLRGASVYALDLGALLAGTRYRGDFEGRLKAVLAALDGQNSVLFIDELHTLVGAGATEGGSVDAANLLKPALARGKLRVMGATTPAELRLLEKDRALWRRFQTVDVPEPSEADAVQILQGLAPKYAAHHGVTYTPPALEAAVRLSARYLRDRFLPDKAIDVLDEAGAARSSTGQGGEIDVPDIESTVARMARVPVGAVKAEEVQSLATLEADLNRRVYGQEPAVSAVSSAVKLARAGLRNPQKPQGSFLFAGPTGVGKTELARALAERLGVELIRFDMSEYQEPHTVARLIGAPPGYVGFDQGGLLTDAVAKNPHAVLLLDEIEKAHPDVYNIFLQLMDHGTLTDHAGKKVDGRGLILIFTTNAGAADASRPALGFSREGRAGEQAEAVKRTFTPEFRNRLDAVIYFAPLSRTVMTSVVDKFLRELGEQLTERGVTLTVTPAARARLAELGYDPLLGARPLARVIEDKLGRPLADELLFGRLKDGGAVKVGVQGGEFSFAVS
ncbi:AAA family ATPase [Deinococcus radiodurans]|jgi:ATP-dependent Clp protease ATP-binding subunit ClpA (EC 3.4.21.92)|uniref:ATP-dependent Clp protease, ATP-binding subunit ClpA n=1 Tax=Deinococcus radiodurans (strain ATCC 13939 / DSM 20539 / JCM 16871 / CCUG 27074 / LMG 4051 / NBRC 15346 / NCIMB 9279 / VKM B-1422 / R1) TaxID=243230 RepID=Q9RWS7_DEIRA|nr:AAA family ATPase [Deinococcus radiodurans]AAF10168.1 ATP-dependent Clp protease, ATP-binding subunit ClpA [Deinococcus radiodurans R1 = ATCC 13939 = DSM 20539]ANC72171.1 ATP-dependent Clp protease ATP-binding subunit ClpA [Deinococcus radiodurans R1 = ATCC 13939 = DSM 20539]QEM72535.1 AAA family ATPase [Deinococcus radiodurans]QIP28760.1 AAA domain-containing protein [Deinococcus radiodurans]QIP32535.1 AAA domain-containing protein [Deinococcus radiodurans]